MQNKILIESSTENLQERRSNIAAPPFKEGVKDLQLEGALAQPVMQTPGVKEGLLRPPQVRCPRKDTLAREWST